MQDRDRERTLHRGKATLRGHRLRKNREFRLVFGKGRSVANRFYVLYIIKKRTAQPVRIGFSVSKKVGNSVVRNRVKRVLREAFRLQVENLPDQYDIVVVARKDAAQLSLREAQKYIGSLLSRIGLYALASSETQDRG